MMKKPNELTGLLQSRAVDDHDFRERLLARPRETIEEEFGVTLADDHALHVHDETYDATHVVLPPRSKYTKEEREEARTGAESLPFLQKTLYDPAPPLRPTEPRKEDVPGVGVTNEAMAQACRSSIRRGLDFLESAIDEHGAWHCIRFNVANPNVPRHFERPPFVSAYCVLALEFSREKRARAICAATRTYLAKTIEYPGLWRYYRHLPLDLDSTTLCSLVIETHPWTLLGRNVPQILGNRDEEGRFMTWVLGEDEPDVVSRFRIEADPVVNANVIAYLGDRPETRQALKWLEALVTEDRLEDSSKWYPDVIAICYAIARAVARTRPVMDWLCPFLGGARSRIARRQWRFRECSSYRAGCVGAPQCRRAGGHRLETPVENDSECASGGRELARAACLRRSVVEVGHGRTVRTWFRGRNHCILYRSP